jgi:hypothetical protein
LLAAKQQKLMAADRCGIGKAPQIRLCSTAG